MKLTTMLSVLAAGLLILAGCKTEAPRTSGIELENMDTSVRPQDNFFRFVNGAWLENTEIPADRARWGSFDELRENADRQVLEIIKEAAAVEGAEKGSDEQKIGDLFMSFMDTEKIEELRLEPLSDLLSAIDALSSHNDLANHWGYMQRYRSGTPLGVSVGQDMRQAEQYITYGSQSGLGLPDREYYLSDSEQNQQIIGRYKDLISTFWQLAGWQNGERAANRILAIETRIAESHWTRVENRDRNRTYNKMTIAELTDEAPGFNWQQFLDSAGLGDIDEIVIRQPSYMTEFASFFRNFPVSHWRDYLRFHLIRTSAGLLSSDFDEASFDFYGRVLSGQEEQRSREKRGVSTVESVLGFMVGKAYVERHFQEEARERMDEMVENLLIAFEESIHELEWMTDDTKKEALDKLSTFTTKIGFPEVWRDYDCVEIDASDLMGNMMRSSVCEYDRNINRLGQPVDRDEWGMTPQTVNAYYRSTLNEIVFPAAILQPPFFNVDAEDAVNYGAIGAVIGHEITHGFDDQGRRSDGTGNLRDWWTEQDEEEFTARAQLMIDQYSEFNPIDDLFINGALGLGENIADLGGMNVALRAYRNSLGGEEAPILDGFTGEQRFFMGWGQIWRIKFRDEALRRQIMIGPHAPGKYRVLGVLSNMPEFYEAFDVQPGDPMYREEELRVKIW